VRNARPTTATDTRTTTQEGRGTGGDGRAGKRSGRGADTSPLHGTAGAGAWDTEKPRERSRERGKQRARHGMECGWAKGARVLARFRRQGAGRGGKHDEGLRGVRTRKRGRIMHLRTARRARALWRCARLQAVGGLQVQRSNMTWPHGRGGSGHPAVVCRTRPHDELGALGLARVRLSAARPPPAQAVLS